MSKIRIMVLYGGRSGEHEISLRSAASVIHHLDKNRFDVIPVAVDKSGKWLLNDLSLIEKAGESLPVLDNSPRVLLPPDPGSASTGLIQLGGQKGTKGVDVVFPVMHGPLCEDGTIQGLLELAELPFVGSGVLGSAIGMDKEISKKLAQSGGIPIVPYIALRKASWIHLSEGAAFKKLSDQVKKELGYPVFVKPCNMGSSVGVHKVKSENELKAALEDAFRYDVKVLIEKGISAREIEFSVLEDIEFGNPPLVSTPGEIIPNHEFYSYEAKYLDENGATLRIPADLTPSQKEEGQWIARNAFNLLECEGMARVDLFLDRDSGKFYLNEVNTIPGFTSISMYPKLWEYSGLGYSDLLSKLIDLAIARHDRKRKLVRDFRDSDS